MCCRYSIETFNSYWTTNLPKKSDWCKGGLVTPQFVRQATQHLLLPAYLCHLYRLMVSFRPFSFASADGVYE
jgi:hypothetical protein